MFTHPLGPDAHLRLLEPSDAEEVYALTDANRAHLRAWLPWVDATRSPEDTRTFIRGALQQFSRGDGLHAGVVVRGGAGGTDHPWIVAGTIGFHAHDLANRRTSIGYWLGAAYQGRGLITRACRALLDHAFSGLRLNRVEIRCAVRNPPSRAVPERLGFALEGVARECERLPDGFADLAVYAMLARDWLTLTASHPPSDLPDAPRT